ncbi:sulfurtransferase FdhD [bacterium]|nr:sulfurtransferase FdhD [bacterium]
MELRMAEQKAHRVEGTRVRAGDVSPVADWLAAEAPLQIKVNGAPFTVTMRTPGDDQLLVRGLLHTEGILLPGSADAVLTETRHPETGEVICVRVEVPPDTIQRKVEDVRTFVSASSCGLCGSKELPETRCLAPVRPLSITPTELAARVPALMQAMRARQGAFDQAGGTHAAGLFTVPVECLAVFEDIGRHNAVDKVVGWALRHDPQSQGRIMAVSGRVSWEIVLKAWRAGFGAIAAVSAPSQLAVETAAAAGIVLLAFCREDRATIYAPRPSDL